MIEWIDERLAAAGLQRRGEPEEFRSRPWGRVLRIATSGGTVWFKAAARTTAFEAALYEVLAQVAPERILVPLAIDASRGWMLLPDGGPTLLDAEDREAGLVSALAAYGELQRELAPHVDALLAAGVADMRPAILPQRFEEAMALVPGGELRSQLEALRPAVAEWCAELAASPLPASLDHNDLHFANVVAGNRFYDWGDSVVAHPFAVALVPRMVLADPDPALDAYLRGFGDPAELRPTLDLACRVARIPRALVWERALAAAREQGEAIDPFFADAQLDTLRELLPGG